MKHGQERLLVDVSVNYMQKHGELGRDASVPEKSSMFVLDLALTLTLYLTAIEILQMSKYFFVYITLTRIVADRTDEQNVSRASWHKKKDGLTTLSISS